LQHNCIIMKQVLFVFCFFLTLQLSAQPFVGKVIDKETQLPVSGANVSLFELGISTQTDTNGIFVILTSLPQQFQYLVEKTEYKSFYGSRNSSDSDRLIIALESSHIQLDQIVIVDTRGLVQKESVTHIERKKISELNEVKSTNLGEALSKIPGVYSASTGNGISKPVVRGLSGTRVLTLLNGIRIENQQWGSDHGMALTSLGIGTVEVVKGPSSLYYGSDALGGILYFTDEAYTSNGNIEQKLSSSFEFNGYNSQNSVGVKFAERHLRMNVFAGYNSAADFRLPNKNYLVNSRYNDKLAKLALGYNKGNWVTNVRYTYLNSHVGIPGESEDSIVTPLSYQSDKTSRTLSTPFQGIENHIFSWENRFFLTNGFILSVNLGNTNNHLSEFEENLDTAALSMKLNTSVYNVRLNKRFGNNTQLSTGFQGMYQQNRNAETAEERLIPNANSIDNGFYAVIDSKLLEHNVQAGIRADLRNIDVVDDSISFGKQFGSINYSVGAMRRFTNSIYRVSVSSGFRAPHTSELLANGAHEGALRYEIGSTALKTENATQVDVTYEYSKEHFSFVINPFYNQINNYIYLNPIDSVIDERPVYQYSQADNVSLYGIDAGFHIHPHPIDGLHLEVNYSYVRGEHHSGTSLPFIPQSRINTTIKIPMGSNPNYGPNAGFFVVQYSYNFKQTRISDFETATSDYSLLDLGMSLLLSDEKKSTHKINFTCGVKNVTNTKYMNHLSSLKNIGIPQQGRNFYLGLSIELQQKKKTF
jgi:iron complex outermembrane recepter protein